MADVLHGNPLNQISHVDRLANNTKNDKLALAPTVLSVILVAEMAYAKFQKIMRDNGNHRTRAREYERV